MTEQHESRAADPLVTGVVFSKDRALQLDATISSFFRHLADPNEIRLNVLFAATNPSHKAQYDTLAKTYPNVVFHPEHQFQTQLKAILQNAPYTLFLVDDNIFVRPFSLQTACKSLGNDDNTLGVSLRLGTNTNYCYSLNQPQRIPQYTRTPFGLLSYNWSGEECDFNYALEVSSSIYRTDLIQLLLSQTEFTNPNTLEARLYDLLPALREPFPALLCYEKSVTFCNPINIVQTEYTNNRAGGKTQYSSASLSALFDSGQRIAVERYDGYNSRAAHEEVELYLKSGQNTGGAN